MTPGCLDCELQPYGRHCSYHRGYEDGYEAAQRERDEASPSHVPKALKEFAARGYERTLPNATTQPWSEHIARETPQ